MRKRYLFIGVLLFVFGITGIAGATLMHHRTFSPQDADFKSWRDGDLMKKVLSWKEDRTNTYGRKLEREWLKRDKTDIFKKIGALSGDFKKLRGSDKLKIKIVHWFYKSKRCEPNPVPESATLLLLGFGMVAIAGLGRKNFKNKRKK